MPKKKPAAPTAPVKAQRKTNSEGRTKKAKARDNFVRLPDPQPLTPDPSASPFRDRIRELRRVPAAELRANPKNWREHPAKQREALTGMLRDVGFADAVIARECDDGTLELIDGHLRADIDPAAIVPVLVLDVSAAEADKLLLTLDPLAAMATANKDALEVLLRGDSIHTGEQAVADLFEGLARANDIIPKKSRGGGGGGGGGSQPVASVPATQEFGVFVACGSAEHQAEVLEALLEAGYECRIHTAGYTVAQG